MAYDDLEQMTLQALWRLARQQGPNAALQRRLAADKRVGAQAIGHFLERQRLHQRKLVEQQKMMLRHEGRLWRKYAWVAGVDEVGMGPLAGPVVAGAVILPADRPIPLGLDDSKRLTAQKRHRLQEQLHRQAVAYALGWVFPLEMVRINLYQAGLLAMHRAVAALPVAPQALLLDARRLPTVGVPQFPLVGGDRQSASIAAASIIAKCARDGYMVQQDSLYPDYGFAVHKGYPTPFHLEVLARLGPTPLHRPYVRPAAEQVLAG